MKIFRLLVAYAAYFLVAALPTVLAKDEEEDDDGFFYFQDDNDWSESAIYPMSCIETSEGDAVVYQMYKKGHNQCKRRSLGKYKMDVDSFIRAYVSQLEQDYLAKGAEYEVDDEAMEYLQCQQYYYNNNMYYLKVGCRSTGKGFMVHAYTDMYCSEKLSYNLNLGVDLSGLRVQFDTCKNCVTSSSYGNNNKYNNNNNAYNNYNNQGGGYGYGDMSQHESMLCSSADHYKDTCNRSCRRAANKAGSSSSSKGWGGGGGSWDGDGFSPIGKFFLWVLSLSAIFFLLAGLAQRKKMSKQDALIEEAAIKASGVDKKYIPRIFVGLILFIIILILFRRKVLTWFFLIGINIGLLAYWMHLKNKAEQNAAANGFQLYGDGAVAA